MTEYLSQEEQDDLRKLDHALSLIDRGDYISAKKLLQSIAENIPDTYQAVSSNGDGQVFRYWDEDELIAYKAYCYATGNKYRIIGIESVYPKALYHLAMIIIEEGKIDNGIKLLDEILRLEPDQPRCFTEIAYVAATHKEFESAFALYLKALEIRPFISNTLKAHILRGMGVMSIELENFDSARKYLQESIIFAPNNSLTVSHKNRWTPSED